MKTTLEYYFHGLSRNVEVELIEGKRSVSANILKNRNEKPNIFP
jgi:hypothetical protein